MMLLHPGILWVGLIPVVNMSATEIEYQPSNAKSSKFGAKLTAARQYAYNPQENTVFGRTGTSWGEYLWRNRQETMSVLALSLPEALSQQRGKWGMTLTLGVWFPSISLHFDWSVICVNCYGCDVVCPQPCRRNRCPARPCLVVNVTLAAVLDCARVQGIRKREIRDRSMCIGGSRKDWWLLLFNLNKTYVIVLHALINHVFLSKSAKYIATISCLCGRRGRYQKLLSEATLEHMVANEDIAVGFLCGQQRLYKW